MLPLLLTSLTLSAILAAVPARGGQPGEVKAASVTLLPDGRYYAALMKGVEEAKKEILLGTFLFTTRGKQDNLADRLVAALGAAAKRGVRVTVVLEQDGRRKEPTAGNRSTGALLSGRGVRVLYDDPRVTSHAKLAVIDGRWVFVGSHNLTDAALDHNREYSVLLDSPEAAAELKSWVESLPGGSPR